MMTASWCGSLSRRLHGSVVILEVDSRRRVVVIMSQGALISIIQVFYAPAHQQGTEFQEQVGACQS